MDEIDVYPVGWLRDWQSGHRWRRPMRYLWRQVKAGHWRDAKNTFNGYLAEPVSWPDGLRRCGSGWTKARALKSLDRLMSELPPHPEAKTNE